MLRRRQDDLPRSAPLDTQTPNFSLKIEQFLELLVQGDAENQRQLGGGIELPRLNGADGVAGHAHQLRQLGLGQPLLRPGHLQPVFQNQLALLTEKAPAFSVCIPDSSCRFVAAEKEKKERICSYDYYFKKGYRPAKSQ